MQAHSRQTYPVAVSLTRTQDQIEISASSTTRGTYVVELIRYTPSETVEIRRGENAGKALRYSNIVKSLDVIANWDGAGVLSIRAAVQGNDPIVVLVQRAGNGPIVGAAQLR